MAANASAQGDPVGRAPGAARAHALIALALVLATFAVYGQVREHEFLIYDDPDYVLENPLLRSEPGWPSLRAAFSRPYLGNWAPLTLLSLRLDFALYGLEPRGYLLGNVALHAFASLVLYLALARMTGARGRSAFVAGVFALHPLHVESVAWASERKDVLSGAFFMLALYAHARHAEHPGPLRLALVTLCGLLGLLAKATLVTLPCVLLLLDFWPLGRLRAGARDASGAWRRAVGEKLPLFALAAAIAAITYLLQREAGAMSALERIPLELRVRNALEAYVTYAASSFWPSGLAVFHPHAHADAPLWRSAAAGLLLAGVSAGVARGARARPWLAVGWLWYLGMLVPMIGLIQVGMQSHADRYMYLPQTGLAIAVAWGACEALERLRVRRLATPAALAALAALALCAWQQVGYWRNSFTLFEHALAVTSDNAVAHLQLGDAHLRAGNPDAAERHYAQAAAIDPHWMPPRLGLADVHATRGDLAAALAGYQRELERAPGDPNAAGRYGVALLRLGRIAEARVPLERASAAHPGAATLHAALAVVYTALGRTQDAIRSNRAALRFDAGQLEAANNLAWLLATRASASPAERQEAVELAERANRGRGGDDATLLDTLAVAYAAAGRFDEAVATAERAARAADASGQAQAAREIRARSALFTQRRPYVESPQPAPDTEG